MKKFLSLLTFILLGTVCGAQIHYVQDMTTSEIAALERGKTVVLLPGGILEQHGPYLPAFTDGYINQDLTKQIANSIIKRPGWRVLIFPIIPLGSGGANEIGRKYSFSGTYAVRQKTLRSILMDLGCELGEQGFKTIFVIHVHGSPNHNQAIDQASDFFTEVYKGRMANVHNLRKTAIGQDIRSEAERTEDGFAVHAGLYETSILHYLKPEFQKTKYKEARPQTATIPIQLVTIAKENDWPGYFGSPRLATAAFGEKAWKQEVNDILEQITLVLDNKYDFTKPTIAKLMSGIPVFKSINEDAKNFDKEREAKQNEWLKSKGLE